ncbi:MAG: hypothetical protein DRH17_03355 [Deltaproteobacteria bacterium]|nr:MAG: hypothetical protein DRH17_03355 [Deltaproteobacteria bacterium]
MRNTPSRKLFDESTVEECKKIIISSGIIKFDVDKNPLGIKTYRTATDYKPCQHIDRFITKLVMELDSFIHSFVTTPAGLLGRQAKAFEELKRSYKEVQSFLIIYKVVRKSALQKTHKLFLDWEKRCNKKVYDFLMKPRKGKTRPLISREIYQLPGKQARPSSILFETLLYKNLIPSWVNVFQKYVHGLSKRAIYKNIEKLINSLTGFNIKASTIEKRLARSRNISTK